VVRRIPRWDEAPAGAGLHRQGGDGAARGGVGAAELSVETTNHYLRAVKGFARWLVRSGRAPDNPLDCLTLLNARADRRHDRRALEPDELLRLLDAARNGPERFGMTGPLRGLVYQLAVETGLRVSELRSLTWGSFDLDADPPTVTVKAAYCKHRRDDTLPLKPLRRKRRPAGAARTDVTRATHCRKRE